MVHPNIEIPHQQPAPVRSWHKHGVVLVLGSGGARGYAHIGVLQALESAHIPINGIVCASAGCLVGALYADNQSARKTYDIMMQAGFWDFADMNNFLHGGGLIRGDHFQLFLLKHMHARTFRQLKIPLIVATTDLLTGKTYLIRGGPVAPAALASAAIPGAVRPVRLYGRILVDGGVAAPVPTHYARLFDPRLVIAVNISQQLVPEIPTAAYSIYNRAYDIMWERLSVYSQENADVVIRPKVGQIGTFDIGDRYSMYLSGLHAGQKAIKVIKKKLNATTNKAH